MAFSHFLILDNQSSTIDPISSYLQIISYSDTKIGWTISSGEYDLMAEAEDFEQNTCAKSLPILREEIAE